MPEALSSTREGPVARLRLDRPELHNAFDAALIGALTAGLERLADDPHVRVVVLEGSGRSFSAGADLNWMRGMASADEATNREDALALARLMRTLDELPKPTIARVHGAAMGGGVGLVACCDIAIGVPEAKFGLTEARLGLLPAVISPYVIAAIGPRQARRWFATDAEYARQPRPFRAPRPLVTPRFVVVEQGDTLQRLLSRYEEGVEIVAVRTLEEAIAEIGRLPAHALVLNDRRFEHASLPAQDLMALAYGTPVVACWVPGQTEAADRLGLVRYLLKPVSREALLAALEALPRPVRTVLVVDDEPEALQLFARMLTSAERGYRVLRAPDGRRALTLLRQRRPDAMLLDLVMPGMDGYSLLRAKSLDETIRHIPTIAISAQDPSAGPIASGALTISRSGGLQVQDLLSAIRLTAQTLAPPDRLDVAPDQARPETTDPAPQETPRG